MQIQKNIPNLRTYKISQDGQVLTTHSALKIKKSTILILPDSFSMQWRIQDFPLGGRRPVGGGANLQHVHFSAKTKEIDPVGGGGGPAPPWIRQWYDIYFL